MNCQNAINFTQRENFSGQHPQDKALRMAAGTGLSFNYARGAVRRAGTGAVDPFAAAAAPVESGGGMTGAQITQAATAIGAAVTQLGVSIYASQLQQQQAKRDAELQKQLLEVQKNQQALDAYKLLSSSQGQLVAASAPAPSGNVLSGGAAIAAAVALGALLLMR